MELFLGIAILVVASQWARSGFPGLRHDGQRSTTRRIPVAYRSDPELHKAALEAYKHAVTEKMDVMRVAIQHGWGDEELQRLDARLEELIGQKELKRLLDGELPAVSRIGAALDPQQELGRLRQQQGARG